MKKISLKNILTKTFKKTSVKKNKTISNQTKLKKKKTKVIKKKLKKKNYI